MVIKKDEKKEEKTNGLPAEQPRDPNGKLGDAFVVFGADSEKYGPGAVRIKTGDDKKDWLNLSYMQLGKFIQDCRKEPLRTQILAQIEKERSAINIGDF